jgi:ubiquinone/menaquinone biosynthesis C-methylase UbiE
MQKYYSKEYHSEATMAALLADYSLTARLSFFQAECIDSNARVLDFGCGTGAILTGLKGVNRSASYGVDVSENAIGFAKAKFPDYNWLQVPIDSALPFDNNRFDVVLSSEVIEHVFDVDNYLRELHRVLKPGGILGLSCPFHGFLKDLLILLSGKFESHFHNPYDPHIRFYSMKSIRDALDKNSFQLIKKQAICARLGFAPLGRMVAVKAKAIG